jgi:hypothetical protein
MALPGAPPSPVASSDYALDCAPWEGEPTGVESATAWLYTPPAWGALLGFFVPTLAALLLYFVWARARPAGAPGEASARGAGAPKRQRRLANANGGSGDDGDGARLLDVELTAAGAGAVATRESGSDEEETQEGFTDARLGRANLALLATASVLMLILQARPARCGASAAKTAA